LSRSESSTGAVVVVDAATLDVVTDWEFDVVGPVSLEQPATSTAIGRTSKNATATLVRTALSVHGAVPNAYPFSCGASPKTMAEWEGFEPSRRVTPAYTISSRAP
jgi:hypothetical protein